MFIGNKMHEDKSLMCSIQCFSTSKTPQLWDHTFSQLWGHTFSFELIIKCYKGLVVLWLKGHLNPVRTYCEKCTVTKLREI
jgi:hypothetical protein